ncbi:MAG: hypothetical protein M1825_003124 [Sarcosagium campestre]|nr:MAG: hypothetical protein M1825_003124 [Sarcosagium campestre]
MGQYWYILSLGNDEILYCGKLEEFMWNNEADCLVELFAVPVKPSLSCETKPGYDNLEIEPLPTKANLTPTCKIQSRLTSIPDELLLEVFRHLDIVSCFRLSLVSKRLWSIGWPFFRHKITEFMGTWAGVRTICLGDDCEPSDLPAGLLTTEEEDAVNEGLDSDEENSDGDSFSGKGNLLDIARCRFRKPKFLEEHYRMFYRPVPGEDEDLLFSGRSQTWRLPRTLLSEARHLPKSELSQVYRFASGNKVTDYYPKAESWYLRNLTTTEFVQGDRLYAAFHRSRPPSGPHLGYPGFGEAIMCRICWSTCSLLGIPFAGLNRGAWAGHRLEICTEKYHASNSNDTWKDVTSEIVHEISVVLELQVQTAKRKRIEDP